jgi:transcriptional regulator with XRE-family HTH domain
MTFAQRLRELREQAGLTQESLAYKTGMSVSSIRNYEQGIREPYWKGVFQLAKALSVSSEAFAVCVKDGAAGPAPARKSRKK